MGITFSESEKRSELLFQMRSAARSRRSASIKVPVEFVIDSKGTFSEIGFGNLSPAYQVLHIVEARVHVANTIGFRG